MRLKPEKPLQTTLFLKIWRFMVKNYRFRTPLKIWGYMVMEYIFWNANSLWLFMETTLDLETPALCPFHLSELRCYPLLERRVNTALCVHSKHIRNTSSLCLFMETNIGSWDTFIRSLSIYLIVWCLDVPLSWEMDEQRTPDSIPSFEPQACRLWRLIWKQFYYLQHVYTVTGTIGMEIKQMEAEHMETKQVCE